ncbi:MAG: hypothetical protein KIT84_06860 [Labilithrix sp.]|nr:hypothetical protein [Labilithrix sp.]MCW5810714.1 hypothetical protein [Labilithrix sp.]
MTTPKRVFSCILVAAFWLACGDDDDAATAGNDRNASCTTLCSEAQAGSCTSIKGDCGAFCSALDSAGPKANCTAQRNAYQSCLNSRPSACQASCNGPERTLTECLLPYCAQNSSDSDCSALIAALR